MEEAIKYVPDQLWKPMGLLMLGLIAFLLGVMVIMGRMVVNKFVEQVKENLKMLSTDMSQVKEDLAELVGVSKLHEHRLNDHDDDITEIRGNIFKYRR